LGVTRYHQKGVGKTKGESPCTNTYKSNGKKITKVDHTPDFGLTRKDEALQGTPSLTLDPLVGRT